MTDFARVSIAHHEATHAIVAELLGVRTDVVSIRPADHHAGVTIHAAVRVSEVAELLGRRRGTSLLADWGSVPVALFDPQERCRAEVQIMINLAGRLGEFLAPEPSTDYLDDAAALFDQSQALATASELTAEQRDWLTGAEHSQCANDEDSALDNARRIAGDEAAELLVSYLAAETRRFVFSALVRSLVPPVVDQLLAHEVIGGKTVREIVERVTGRARLSESVT